MKISNKIRQTDPEFYMPDPTDLLVGAVLFWILLCPDKIYGSENKPLFQETKLGWVVSGFMGKAQNINISCYLSSSNSTSELH